MGPAHRIVQTWLADAPFDVLACPDLLDEVTDVLGRPHLARLIEAETAARFVQTIRATVLLVANPPAIAADTHTFASRMTRLLSAIFSYVDAYGRP